MNRTYLYTLLKDRKVIICVIIGIIFLLVALAITYNYFGIRDFENSKLMHFSENLANSLDDRLSWQQWLFAQTDSLEVSLQKIVEQGKQSFIGKFVQYLEDHVPWWRVWITIISFIATCLFIFEFFRSKIAQIVGEDRAPFSWKLDTEIIGRFRNLNSWKPIVEYFGEGFTTWSNGKISQAKEKIQKIVEEDMPKMISDLYVRNNLTTGLRDPEIDQIISARIISELEKSSLLFLIEQVSANDHFARFWEEAVRAFRTNAIQTDSYFFNTDPRLCFRESDKQGVFLSKLAERHPESILVVIGSGSAMIQSGACQLQSWTEALKKWETRFLFSPKNYFSRDRREGLLGELFHVVPAKFSSLQYIDNKPNHEGHIDYAIETHAHEHIIDYETDVFNEHTIQKYFSNTYSHSANAQGVIEKKYSAQPLLDWIHSCAITKNLDFQLSLGLGQANFDRYEDASFTPEAILSVFQLPWFRRGKIDDGTRAFLIKRFDEESAEVAGDIRKFLQMKLPKWRPPDESVAGDTFSETEQINEWTIKDPEPDSVTKQNVKKELNKVYGRGMEPDLILSVTDGVHNRYSRYFPARLRPFIFNYGYSGLGLTQRLKSILYSLLAGLILFVFYCIIIWLSRPMSGDDGCPECPPSIYSCVPITQLIGASENEPKKITLTGTAKKPLLAYLTGFRKDCCVPIEIRGSEVTLMIGEDTIGWMPGDTMPAIRQLAQSETLRMQIRDHIHIIVADSTSLTLFIPVFDTVQVKTINLNKDTIIDIQGEQYFVWASKSDQICPSLKSPLIDRPIFRKDTVLVSNWPDTSILEIVINSPKPDTLIREFNEKLVRLIYEARRTIYSDTIRIPSGEIRTDTIRVPLLCPECPPQDHSDSIVVNIACVGDDLDKLMTKPTLRLNGRVIVSERDFVNPVKIPFESITEPKLEFKLEPPHRFRSGEAVLIVQFSAKNTQIDLDVYDPTDNDSILQIKGDIIVLDANTNYTTKVDFTDSNLRLYHCWGGEIKDTIEHQNGYFCHNLKGYSFCGSRIQIEYNGEIHGSKLIREYKVLTTCVDNMRCADFSTIGIKSDTGISTNLSPCQVQ